MNAKLNVMHEDFLHAQIEIQEEEQVSASVESWLNRSTALQKDLEQAQKDTEDAREDGDDYRKQIAKIYRDVEVDDSGMLVVQMEIHLKEAKAKIVEVKAELDGKNSELAAARAEATSTSTAPSRTLCRLEEGRWR